MCHDSMNINRVYMEVEEMESEMGPDYLFAYLFLNKNPVYCIRQYIIDKCNCPDLGCMQAFLLTYKDLEILKNPNTEAATESSLEINSAQAFSSKNIEDKLPTLFFPVHFYSESQFFQSTVIDCVDTLFDKRVNKLDLCYVCFKKIFKALPNESEKNNYLKSFKSKNDLTKEQLYSICLLLSFVATARETKMSPNHYYMCLSFFFLISSLEWFSSYVANLTTATVTKEEYESTVQCVFLLLKVFSFILEAVKGKEHSYSVLTSFYDNYGNRFHLDKDTKSFVDLLLKVLIRPIPPFVAEVFPVNYENLVERVIQQLYDTLWQQKTWSDSLIQWMEAQHETEDRISEFRTLVASIQLAEPELAADRP